jgi:hypothetical protein
VQSPACPLRCTKHNAPTHADNTPTRPQLVEPLLALVEATEEPIASEAEGDGEGGDDEEDEDDEEYTHAGAGGAGSARAAGRADAARAGGAASKPLAVDNGDDALLLLRALAAADERVRGKLKGQSEILMDTRCTVM